MRQGDTNKWLPVTAFDATSGISLDSLQAEDFPTLKIYNGNTAVAIATLSDVTDMAEWVNGGVFNAGEGDYFVGMPDASWQLAEKTKLSGKSETVEVRGSVEVHPALQGPSGVTLTFHDAANVAVPLVEFMIVGQGPGIANTSGMAAFGLANGTYTVRAKPINGTLFPDTTLIVNSTTALTITGTAVTLPAASDPSQSRGSLRCYDQQGNAEAGAKVIIQQCAAGETGGWPNNFLTVTSDADGDLVDPKDSGKAVLHARGVEYRARRGTAPDTETAWAYYTVPDAPSFAMPPILGKD